MLNPLPLIVLLLTVQGLPTGDQTGAQVVPVGERVVVEGIVDIVSASVFCPLGPTPLDVGTSNLLVFPDTTDGFRIDIKMGCPSV